MELFPWKADFACNTSLCFLKENKTNLKKGKEFKKIWKMGIALEIIVTLAVCNIINVRL